MTKTFFLWVVLFCISDLSVQAQYDSSYIDSYRGYLMPRFLVNRKTTSMNVKNSSEGYSLRYQPNKTFSVGIGATYKFATFNVSVGVLKPSEARGQTRDLDLQFHSYGRKVSIDFLTQFYKGFYLPERRFAVPGQEFYVRSDLAVSTVGIAAQYVFNNRRFSYRAAFQQTEWQKKSAGTLLVGAELFTGRFKGDSTIVPPELQHDTHTESVRKMRFVEGGPSLGFAYTWVYKKFFATAGGSLSLNIGVNKFFDANSVKTFIGVSPNTMIRLSTGYNVNRWGLNLMFLSTALHLPEVESRSVVMNAGTIRLNLIYRLYPKKDVKKYLKVIDKVDEKLSD